VNLQHRVALITGASRGLGRAAAIALSREGAVVSICARHPQQIERVAEEVRTLGGTSLAIQGDLRSERDIERIVSLTLDRFGAIDILVNNAGELGPTPLPYLADLPRQAFSDVLLVNLEAPFRLTQSVVGGMLLRDSGVIVNITSDAALTGYAGWGAYSASKAAIEALTRTWAAELEGTGVKIFALDPGDMDTDMHRAAIPDADPAQLARPEDVARALVRLLAQAEHLRNGDRLAAASLPEEVPVG
jgi:NAD(P)-dependent dehydrogenase (short-subunit alcohol dehydrogenase family)